jgi:hypothetical protein
LGSLFAPNWDNGPFLWSTQSKMYRNICMKIPCVFTGAVSYLKVHLYNFH